MPALKTIARAEGDHVTVRIIPSVQGDDAGTVAGFQPAWAGLCEGNITKNADGPHDMKAVRESIRSEDQGLA